MPRHAHGPDNEEETPALEPPSMASMLEQLVGRLDGMQADITGSISALAGRMDAGEHAVADLTAQMRGGRAQHQSPPQNATDDQQDAPPAPQRVLFEADIADGDPPAPAPAPGSAGSSACVRVCHIPLACGGAASLAPWDFFGLFACCSGRGGRRRRR